MDILKIANKIDIELEMHDRLIVATTIYYEATLITKDKLIRESKITAVRWDEQEARKNEAYISPRENPSHTRIHPILHFCELIFGLI